MSSKTFVLVYHVKNSKRNPLSRIFKMDTLAKNFHSLPQTLKELLNFVKKKLLFNG